MINEIILHKDQIIADDFSGLYPLWFGKFSVNFSVILYLWLFGSTII